MLWDSRRPQSANTALKNAQIALADAIGWVDGFLWAGYCRNWDPMYYCEYLDEAAWFAEVASARAAKK